MNLIKSYITKNDCYKDGRKIVPKGIMVHSTATPGVMAEDWFSRWNRGNLDVAVHAFVDDDVVCQHLPWNHRAWHCAYSGNNTHIAFEMCEPTDWKTNKAYFKKCYTNAVELTAFLCKKYNLTEKQVISHKEGYKKGIASNHGDPDHWWKNFGYNMDKFRADVKKALAGDEVKVVIIKTRATLSKWDVGEDVKYLQKRLNHVRSSLGLSFTKLATDGVFGDNTEKAVKELQKKRKITVDGIVGKDTWATVEVNFGDVDGDGKISAADAQTVLKATVGKEKLTAKQKKAADMDADGKVGAADAQEILKRTVGK